LATVAVFLPAFVYVGLGRVVLPRLRGSAVAASFLDGVNVAAVALMAVVTWQLGRAAVIDFATVAIAVVSLVLVFRCRVGPLWLVIAGAILGLCLATIGCVPPPMPR
jgi:chromate transporter